MTCMLGKRLSHSATAPLSYTIYVLGTVVHGVWSTAGSYVFYNYKFHQKAFNSLLEGAGYSATVKPGNKDRWLTKTPFLLHKKYL